MGGDKADEWQIKKMKRDMGKVLRVNWKLQQSPPGAYEKQKSTSATIFLNLYTRSYQI